MEDQVLMRLLGSMKALSKIFVPEKRKEHFEKMVPF